MGQWLPAPQCVLCHDLFAGGLQTTGVYDLTVLNDAGEPVTVRAVCDMTDGGYTLIQQLEKEGLRPAYASADQRNLDDGSGASPFRGTWAYFKAPFGDVSVSGAHWLGLDNMHWLTSNCGPQVARIDVQTCNGSYLYEDYSFFHVSPVSQCFVCEQCSRGPM